MFHLRLSPNQQYVGEVRNAISAVTASNADVKHIFALDDDIDIFSDAEIVWALAG
ncbi:UbiD family decarboxylase [Pusillimonas noertemannii]|nr:UbiD family decarboxylase [Pusillimonas noertemannii]TFL12245.1 hypothetical protein CSC72_03785 [Pusillimonas noertemannii]